MNIVKLPDFTNDRKELSDYSKQLLAEMKIKQQKKDDAKKFMDASIKKWEEKGITTSKKTPEIKLENKKTFWNTFNECDESGFIKNV